MPAEWVGPSVHFELLRLRVVLRDFIFPLHRRPFPAITGTWPAIWRASQPLLEGRFYVFSKTGSCRPVAPSSRAKAEPIAGADGLIGETKHAFDSDNLSFLGALQHNDAFNKMGLLNGAAAWSFLEIRFPSQTFAPRDIRKP